MKQDEYVKIVAVNGDYRYGYITTVLDKGFTLGISLFDEGESKLAYDAAHNALVVALITSIATLRTNPEIIAILISFVSIAISFLRF